MNKAIKKFAIKVAVMGLMAFMVAGCSKHEAGDTVNTGRVQVKDTGIRYAERFQLIWLSEAGVIYDDKNEGLVHLVTVDEGEDMVLCYDPNCKHIPATSFQPDPECMAAHFFEDTHTAYYEGSLYFFVQDSIFSHKIYKMKTDGAGRSLVAELPFGYDHKYTYSHFGYNLKVTDMQAAVGCEQLKKFPGFIERRRQNWARLRAALEPVADKLILPEPAENSEPSWFGFLISVKPDSGLDRNKITQYMEDHNVQTRLLFSGNLIKHPAFNQIRGTDAYRVAGELTTTDFIMNNTFWIGVYPGMTEAMIDYMAVKEE